MALIFKDPLLDVARAILIVFMGIVALGAAAALIAGPVVALNGARIAERLAEAGSTASVGELQVAVIVVLVFSAALLATIFYAALQLKRIIDTVSLGDPFVPANAQRLQLMAWLTLGAQIVVIPLAIFTMKVVNAVKGDGHVHADVSAEGFFLVLILFILARVFRKGTEMRDDLEGTV